MPNNKGFSTLFLLITIPLLLILTLIGVYFFVLGTSQIVGNSMLPTYSNASVILVDKLTYKTGNPKMGEIVLFRTPTNQDIDFIGRVIGLPGETIQLKDGGVYINNSQIEEPYIMPNSKTWSYTDPKNGFPLTSPYKIPENSYIILIDNREHGSDSRIYGPIVRSVISDKVITCLLNCNLPQPSQTKPQNTVKLPAPSVTVTNTPSPIEQKAVTTAPPQKTQNDVNYKVSGLVYKDENCNGIKEDFEGTVPGVTINIFNKQGYAQIATIQSDESGNYSWQGTIPGTYDTSLDIGPVSLPGYKSNAFFDYSVHVSKDSPSEVHFLPQVPNEDFSSCQKYFNN